ncbi:MAG: transcriptional regulator [Gemmatimonadetes bacterium]|jgi:HTH-type transcriptional regulator/antitoxin HigA|nr:transcriptional regulator [Gemmatimonadota bacterium]
MHTVLDAPRIRVIRTEEEYETAVAEIDRLLDLEPESGTEEYDRLEVLSVFVQAYEEEHHPIDDASVTPQDIVRFMLEQKGMERSDLNELLGGKSRVSEFLNGVRPLSINQVRALRDHLGIPADLLISRAEA